MDYMEIAIRKNDYEMMEYLINTKGVNCLKNDNQNVFHLIFRSLRDVDAKELCKMLDYFLHVCDDTMLYAVDSSNFTPIDYAQIIIKYEYIGVILDYFYEKNYLSNILKTSDHTFLMHLAEHVERKSDTYIKYIKYCNEFNINIPCAKLLYCIYIVLCQNDDDFLKKQEFLGVLCNSLHETKMMDCKSMQTIIRTQIYLHSNVYEKKMKFCPSIFYNSINHMMIDYCKKYIMENENQYNILWTIIFINNVEKNYIVNNYIFLMNRIISLVDESYNFSIEFQKRSIALPWKDGIDQLISLTPALIIDEILYDHRIDSFPFTRSVMKYKIDMDIDKIFFPQKHNNFLLEKHINHMKIMKNMFYNDFVNIVKHIEQI